MTAWISVEDEMPDKHITILFWSSMDNNIRIGAFYTQSRKFISDGDKYYESDVTHWMPLPEKPKEIE